GELHPTRGIGFEQASPTERLERAVALCGGEGRHRRRDPGTKPTPQDARRLRVSSLFGRGTDEPGAQERGPGGRHINTGFRKVANRPVKGVKEQEGWRGQCFEKLKSRIEARRAGLQGGAPAGHRLAGAPEPKSSQCLVDDSKREARFGGIAPSDADLEATA